MEIKRPDNQIVVFSGDLGASNTPLLPDPVSPERADYLYLESTYGDKTHDNVAERGRRLKAIIHRSLTDGGTMIIPAFSVGRTQELLFDIEHLIHQEQLDSKLPDYPRFSFGAKGDEILPALPKAVEPGSQTTTG